MSRLVWTLAAIVTAAVARVTGAAVWYRRSGRVHLRAGRHAGGVAAYGEAMRRAARPPTWLQSLGRELEEAGHADDAASLYETALERPHLTPELIEQLASGLRRCGRPAAAVRALSMTADLEPDPARWIRAAELCEEHGAAPAAVDVLRDAVTASPTTAELHRELARAAAGAAARGGGFALDDGLGRLRRFEPVAAPSSWSTARDALRRAVELDPERTAWWAALGEALEATGELPAALDRFDAAVNAARASGSTWLARRRHLWEFHLERLHAELGQPRVDDPLFGCEVRPTGSQAMGPWSGVATARFTHQGLNVGGVVVDPQATAVEILVDDVPLRRLNLVGPASGRRFDYVLRRATIEHFTERATLTVRTLEGSPLAVAGHTGSFELRIPHGRGDLTVMLAEGRRLDKKGMLAGAAETRRFQTAHLGLYAEARRAFRDRFDRPLFALYGTLLGLHRDGELIADDDDMDVGYLAQASDPAGVKAEVRVLIETLVRAGFTVSVNRRGRPFRLHHEGIAPPSVHLDVHPVWTRDGAVWIHNHASFPGGPDDFEPTDTTPVSGVEVELPRRPEVFLLGNYGPGWVEPDPGYVDDRDGVAPEVVRELSAALLTPAELRELAASLEEVSSDAGRFVPIATQPLYPLDRFVE
jgi:tetratricopeptide (TPR) repeat protein